MITDVSDNKKGVYKMKKNRMFLLLSLMSLLVVSGALLAGCGGSNKSSSGKTEIRFSWWGGDSRHTATLNAIKLFEKENPDIKVKAEYSGFDGIVEKMTTQIAGGTAPDLMQINYDWLVNYSPDGTGFYDLSTLKGLDLSGFSDDLLETGKVDGKLNAVPVSINAATLMFNKTEFEKNGIEIPKTWDELFAAAKQFPDGNYPLYESPYSGFLLATKYIQQKYGVQFITKDGELGFSKDQINEALSFYNKLVEDKVLPPVEESVGEMSGASTVNESPAFLEGKYAGVDDWSTQAPVYELALKNADNQELEFLGMPTMDNMKDTGLSVKPAMLFAVSKNTKHPEETAKLLNFILNDEEAVKELKLERGVPANSKAAKILEEDGTTTGIAKIANDYVTENMSPMPLSPYFEASKVSESWSPVMDSFAYGETSLKDATTQIYDGVTKALKEIKE